MRKYESTDWLFELAMEFLEKKKEAQRKQAELQPTDSQEKIPQKVISLDCLKCGSGQTIWAGKGRPRKDGTRLQRILCKDCGKTSLI